MYIILLLITGCRLVSVAFPFAEPSDDLLTAWHEQEAGKEDGQQEKLKCEYREEALPVFPNLLSEKLAGTVFNHFCNNRLLQHTRKPESPPPDMADFLVCIAA